MGLLQRYRNWRKPQPPVVPPPPAPVIVAPSVYAEIKALKEQAEWMGKLLEDEERNFTYGEDGTVQFGQHAQAGPTAEQFGYWYAYNQCFNRPGYTACFFINEAQHRIIRARSRAFTSINPYWHGIQHNVKTHVVGTGHTWTVMPRNPAVAVPPETIAKVQKEIDDFYDNGYRELQKEKLDRKSRDGEYFLQYQERDKKLTVRFVEPLLVWNPEGKSANDDVWFGIQFLRGDYETPVGYYVRRTDWLGGDKGDGTSAWDRMIPADLIQHRKVNVDKSGMRGVPDTYWVQSRLEQSLRTLKAMGTLVQVRAKIAMIRKRINALAGTVQPMLSSQAAATISGPGAQIRNVFQYPEGAILDTSDQAEYQFPGQNIETDKIISSVQADLQAVASCMGLADYMVSGNLGAGSYACHDTETELLTRRGWLRWNQVTEDDVAGTMNPATRAFEWQKIQGIYRNSFTGQLVAIKSAQLDLLVTPNHRMWCQPKDKPWQFMRADELPWFAKLPMRTAPKDGARLDAITLGGAEYIRTIPSGPCTNYPDGLIHKRQPDITVEADPFLAFLGWWISEGCASNGYTVSLNQNAKAVLECEAIERSIAALPVNFARYIHDKWHEYKGVRTEFAMRTWKANNKTLWTWLRDKCGEGSYTKKIPDFIHDLGATQQNLVLTALKLGDGHDRNERHNVYTTMSAALADQLQALAIQCGERAAIRRADSRGRYCISLRQCKDACFDKAWSSRVDYDGMVWCVSVPNGILITRRNGKMAITGNTSMVAEGPVVKTFACHQQDMIDEDREVVTRVIQTAIDNGRLDADTLDLMMIEMHGPALARMGIQESQSNALQQKASVKSSTTWQQENGLNPTRERANQLEEAQHRLKMAETEAKIQAIMAPPAAPGEGGGDSKASGGARNRATSNARPFSPDQEGRQIQRASGATKEEAELRWDSETGKFKCGKVAVTFANGEPEWATRLRESSYEPHPQDEPTQAELEMARVFITDSWLTTTKAEILALAQFPHSPRDDGNRIEYEPGVIGVHLGVADNQNVYAVDADAMMVKHDAMDFVVAGNHMRWEWIPADRIVVDWSYSTVDARHDLLHEIIETRLMALGKWAYALAHKIANYYERLWLLELRPELAALKPTE